MKVIKLSNIDTVTLVDDEDFERLSAYTWRIDPKGYVVTGLNKTTVRIHRMILGTEKGIQIDHKNQNKLDNQKENLREATNTENQYNVPKRWRNKKKPSSIYKGVHLRKDVKSTPWTARGVLNGRRVYLGNFASEEEAGLAYNEFAWVHYGKFACLNK